MWSHESILSMIFFSFDGFIKLTFTSKTEPYKIEQPLMQHAREGNNYCVLTSHDLSYIFFFSQNDIATYKNIKGTTLSNFLK